MDFSKPLSDAELEKGRQIFKTIASYVEDGQGGSIASEDTHKMWRSFGYNRDDQGFVVYKKYWDDFYKGRIPSQKAIAFCKCMGGQNDAGFLGELVKAFDVDKNGFISKEEFADLFAYLLVHNPKYKATSHEEFVKQADVNQDGRVSVEECTQWVIDTTKKLEG